MKQVLVIEDHPLVAEATAQLLERRFEDVQVVTASSASEALRLIDDRRGRWFRIFLDLAIPGAFGLSLAKQLASRGLASVCCVISAYDRDDYVQQLRAWEFLGYIAKSTPVETLVARLGDVMSGIGAFPSAVSISGRVGTRLTARQAEILEGIQEGLSSKRIADRMHLAEGTVNNQVAAIMQLLHAESRTHAVAKAISLGLLGLAKSESKVP